MSCYCILQNCQCKVTTLDRFPTFPSYRAVTFSERCLQNQHIGHTSILKPGPTTVQIQRFHFHSLPRLELLKKTHLICAVTAEGHIIFPKQMENKRSNLYIGCFRQVASPGSSKWKLLPIYWLYYQLRFSGELYAIVEMAIHRFLLLDVLTE